MKNFNGISMLTFYKFGAILFGAGVIGAGINAKMQWASINLGGKISMVSSFFFQCLLLTLFIGLYVQFKKQANQPKIVEAPAVDDFLKELTREDSIQNVKGGITNGKKIITKNKY